MTENDNKAAEGKERIFIAVCIVIAMAGAAWFYFTGGSGKVFLAGSNPDDYKFLKSSGKSKKPQDINTPPSGGLVGGGTAASGITAKETDPTKPVVVVHVAGNVKNPGVYELPYGSRVKDGINAAGGMGIDADTNSLNLAEVLTDGQKVLVLSKAQSSPATLASASAAPQTPSALVNINTADAKTLETLPGIGPALAQRIVDYRAHKPFSSVDELKNVPGIGEKKFNDIKDNVTLY